MPQIPPWIQPADPLGATVQGYQTGMRIGAEQASQRFQEQQMLMKQQEDAQKQAQWEAEYGLQAQSAARKYQAQREYQKRIGAGEDPLKVLLELGPSIGNMGSAEAAAIRASAMKPKQWSMVPGLPEGISAMQDQMGDLKFVPRAPVQRPQPQYEPATEHDAEGNPISGQREKGSGRFSAFPTRPDRSEAIEAAKQRAEMKRMMDAAALERQIAAVREKSSFPSHIDEQPPDLKWYKGLNPGKRAAFEAERAQIKKLQKMIESLEAGSSPGEAPATPAAAASPAAAAPPSEAPAASPIKPGSIRLAGGVPRGTMEPEAAPTDFQTRGLGRLQRPPIPVQLPPSMAASAPPRQVAPQPAAIAPPTPMPQMPTNAPSVPFGQRGRAGGYEGGIDKLANALTIRLTQLPDNALLSVAKRMGLTPGKAWTRDGDFMVQAPNEGSPEILSREDFIGAIVGAAAERNVSPLD